MAILLGLSFHFCAAKYQLITMRMFIRLFQESIMFAIQALVVNKLRTILSLLGVTIGIFAIISVFTMVDSMEKGIRDGVASLGDDVIFVQKWPWAMGGDYPWWKYWQRPEPSIKDEQLLAKRVNNEIVRATTFMADGNRTVEYLNNNVEGASITMVSHTYNEVRTLDIVEGRYFTPTESASGRNLAIIGADIAEGLFPGGNEMGKRIKIGGAKATVIGVLKKEGESMVGNSMDKVVIIPVNFARNLINVKQLGGTIMAKGVDGVPIEMLKDELRKHMRSIHKLRPREDDDFALNESSVISSGLDGLFSAVNSAGLVIGLFSIIVGGFSIANIMFVSVRERTSLIGIQKALGAKNYFILLQFLFEAVFLCILGGLIGLLLIYGLTFVATALLDMEIILTLKNVITGLTLSAAIGLISGVVPAFSASKLDPVEAIRAN
jgi:putative ABC transport system permease protein